MIRLLIQSVKVDNFDDVIRPLEQHCAWSHAVVLQQDRRATAQVFNPRRGQKMKIEMSPLEKLLFAKFEKKRKIGLNFIFSPLLFSAWNLTWLLYFPPLISGQPNHNNDLSNSLQLLQSKFDSLPQFGARDFFSFLFFLTNKCKMLIALAS